MRRLIVFLVALACAEAQGPADKVKLAISNHKVQIFSKSYCPYCRNVKAIFSAMKVDFHADELDQMEDGSQIQKELEAQTGQRTVPNVFIGGKHVGGFDDTAKAQASGVLQQLLKDAGVTVAGEF